MDPHEEGLILAQQLRNRGIHDERVLDAIARVPRNRFVPEEIRYRAWEDNALPIGAGQTISQPFIVAIMTQELKLGGGERVLEIGTGSGYQTAILAELCREVVTIERIEDLARPASNLLAELSYGNIDFRVGDGTLGCAERAPYQGALVTAAAPEIPRPLYEQLSPGGRMVVPVGDEASQELLVAEKPVSDGVSGPIISEICGCRFVKLIGQAGWQGN